MCIGNEPNVVPIGYWVLLDSTCVAGPVSVECRLCLSMLSVDLQAVNRGVCAAAITNSRPAIATFVLPP